MEDKKGTGVKLPGRDPGHPELQAERSQSSTDRNVCITPEEMREPAEEANREEAGYQLEVERELRRAIERDAAGQTALRKEAEEACLLARDQLAVEKEKRISFQEEVEKLQRDRVVGDANVVADSFVSEDGAVYGPAIELRNATDHVFEDISSEVWRTYRFPDSRGENLEEVTIYEPAWLSVSENGGARILDANGGCHYVPAGWIHLEWEVKDGSPHFVK